MSYGSFVDGKKLNKNDYIVDGAELTLFSQVLNLIASLKSKVGRPDQPIFEDALIELKKSLQEGSFKSVDFLIEQLQLIRLPPNRRRYSKLSTVFAYLIWTASSSAYRALLENEILILPSERTLRRITYKFGSPTQNTSVNYLKARRAGLTSSQSYINLMLDEIYTVKRIKYSSASGKVMGLTQAGEVASTILCFMASTVCDKYQDVVALIPISHLNADKLKEATWNVLQLLAESGFNVVSLCCDNHNANRSFFKNVLCGGVLSSMVYNPVTKRPLFLLFDSVHNLKNIYNNFCKRGILSFPSIDDPTSIKTASFIDIRNLYAEESKQPLKLAHKLTQKSLAPKNIEKTSVKLSNAIFHESTLHALQYFNENQGKQWTGTADFVEIVLKMWKIVNVKRSTQKRSVSRAHQ